MNQSEFILEFLRIFVSWPFVAGIVLIYVFWNYKKPIEDWLRYSPKRGSLPGIGTFESGPIAQETEKPGITPEGDVTKELLGLLSKSAAEAQYWYKLWWFEKTWGIIYRSQIEILEHLSKQNNKQSTWEVLYNFYVNATRLYPSLLNYRYDEYMNFLRANNFVTWEVHTTNPTNADVKITPLGEEFLIYLDNQKYNKNLKIW